MILPPAALHESLTQASARHRQSRRVVDRPGSGSKDLVTVCKAMVTPFTPGACRLARSDPQRFVWLLVPVRS